MLTLEEYIDNTNEKKSPKWCEIINILFESGGKSLTKEQISNMLSGLIPDNRLKKYSDYLGIIKPKEYLGYQPSDDDFLKNTLGKKETDSIAEFIVNYILK